MCQVKERAPRCVLSLSLSRSCPALPCPAPACPGQARPSRQDIEDLPVVDGVGQLVVLLPRRHGPLPGAAVDEGVGVLQRRPAGRAHHGGRRRKEPGRPSPPHRAGGAALRGAGRPRCRCGSALVWASGAHSPRNGGNVVCCLVDFSSQNE